MIIFQYYQDYCTEDEFSPTNVETYIGRETCPCKPLEQCPWFYRLQQRSEKLPKTNRLYKKIVKLIRNSVCDEDSKTVHCCDRNKDGFVPEITDFSVIGGRVRWLLKYIVKVVIYISTEKFTV